MEIGGKERLAFSLLAVLLFSRGSRRFAVSSCSMGIRPMNLWRHVEERMCGGSAAFRKPGLRAIPHFGGRLGEASQPRFAPEYGQGPSGRAD